jgi:hypothetical protein
MATDTPLSNLTTTKMSSSPSDAVTSDPVGEGLTTYTDFG